METESKLPSEDLVKTDSEPSSEDLKTDGKQSSEDLKTDGKQSSEDLKTDDKQSSDDLKTRSEETKGEVKTSNGIDSRRKRKREKVSETEESEEFMRLVTESNPIEDMNLKKCPVCEKDFSSPKLLQCLHPICKECVDKRIEMPAGNGKPRLRCPLKSCNEIMKIYRDLAFTLYDNTFIESEILGRPANGTLCSVCRQKDETILATQRCTDCSAQLCDACAEEHTKGHEVKTYVSLVAEDKEKILAELEDLEVKGKEMDVSKEVEYRREELKEQEEKDLALVEKEVQKMIDRINEEKEKAVTQLQEFYSRQRAKCNSKVVSCQHLKNAITATSYLTRKVMDTGSAADLFNMKKAFENRVNSLMPRRPRPNIRMSCPQIKIMDCHDLFRDKIIFKVTPPIPLTELNASTPVKNKSFEQSGPRAKKQKTFKERQNQRVMIGHVIAAQGPVALRPIQKFSTALPSDVLIPDLVGISMTPDGGLALVDRTNNCIKLFNPGGHFKESFSAHRPESIAAFEDIIAWSNQQSLFFNAKGRGCVYKMDFATVAGRYPLSPYMDKYVLVGNLFRRYLRTINAEGMRVQQIDQKAVSGKVLGNVLYISGNRKGTYILSDLESKKITFTKNTGKPIAQFPPAGDASKNFEPHGVCCEKRGNVFAADNRGHRIFLLNSIGKEIQHWPIHGLVNRPKAITCSSEQEGGYVFVTSDDGHVTVLEYHYRS